jgi:hypothetical protein
MSHTEHIVFFEPMDWSRTYMSWKVVDMNHMSFLMSCLSRGKTACSSGSSIYVTKYSLFILVTFGASRQRGSRAGSMWWRTLIFGTRCRVLALWSRHLSRESTCDAVMYSRQTMTHHWSWSDASHHIRQCARRVTSSFHVPSVFRTTRLSTYAELNANGTIWS